MLDRMRAPRSLPDEAEATALPDGSPPPDPASSGRVQQVDDRLIVSALDDGGDQASRTPYRHVSGAESLTLIVGTAEPPYEVGAHGGGGAQRLARSLGVDE